MLASVSCFDPNYHPMIYLSFLNLSLFLTLSCFVSSSIFDFNPPSSLTHIVSTEPDKSTIQYPTHSH